MPRMILAHLSIDTPADWSLTMAVVAGPQVVAPPENPEIPGLEPAVFQKNLVVTVERVGAEETIDSYLERVSLGVSQSGFSVTQKGSSEQVKLDNGSDGVVNEQVIVGLDGQRVRQMRLVVFGSGFAFVGIASQLDGLPFSLEREAFRKMLLTLDWQSD